MNKFNILFNSSLPVTTPALNEILHHEKVNVSKTHFNKYNELFVLCNSSDDLDTLFLPIVVSQNSRHWGANPSCLLISKRKYQSYTNDVMIR